MNANPPKSAPELVDRDGVGAKAVRDAQGALKQRRGRPKLARPKEQISIRLDRDVVAVFRASGRGWQARINQALRKVLVLE